MKVQVLCTGATVLSLCGPISLLSTTNLMKKGSTDDPDSHETITLPQKTGTVVLANDDGDLMITIITRQTPEGINERKHDSLVAHHDCCDCNDMGFAVSFGKIIDLSIYW